MAGILGMAPKLRATHFHLSCKPSHVGLSGLERLAGDLSPQADFAINSMARSAPRLEDFGSKPEARGIRARFGAPSHPPHGFIRCVRRLKLAPTTGDTQDLPA
jgi:hypothetical protein